MTQNPTFIMIGGFLGAGKTTTVARLAKHYQTLGKRVAIVTNDQATDLVDTNLLRSQGFQVGEVAGSCFCCNFNELTRTVEQLGDANRPDVIIAEPVGSCTDLVATVIRPLQQVYQQPFEIAPYSVILKPSHGLKILSKQKKGGFSPQAEYIFRKQIEEADVILINRIDELADSEVQTLVSLIEEQFPGIPVLRISAKNGLGFDSLCEYLQLRGEFGQRVMDVDYDVYAEGEAELGWLNAQLQIRSDRPFSMDELLLKLLDKIQGAIQSDSTEVAHMKAIGMADGAFSVVNLISSDSKPVLSIASNHSTCTAEMVVNARVAIDPEALDEKIQQSILQSAEEVMGQADIRSIQSFRPGRPVPTHRIGS